MHDVLTSGARRNDMRGVQARQTRPTPKRMVEDAVLATAPATASETTIGDLAVAVTTATEMNDGCRDRAASKAARQERYGV